MFLSATDSSVYNAQLLNGNTPSGMPGSGVGAGFGSVLFRTVDDCQTFGVNCFQVAVEVMPVSGPMAVEVVARAYVAVGIVGNAAGRCPAPRPARL